LGIAFPSVQRREIVVGNLNHQVGFHASLSRHDSAIPALQIQRPGADIGDLEADDACELLLERRADFFDGLACGLGGKETGKKACG